MDLALSALLASTALLQDKQPSRQAVLAHALLDTQRQEQARLSLQIATDAMLAMKAPQRLLVAILADAPFAHLGRLKLLLAIVSALPALPASTAMPLLDKRPNQSLVLALVLLDTLPRLTAKLS